MKKSMWYFAHWFAGIVCGFFMLPIVFCFWGDIKGDWKLYKEYLFSKYDNPKSFGGFDELFEKKR